MKVVIIGGSAGGASVAARLRRLNESAEIVLLEKSATISFANCGIPYYLGGVIKDRDRLNVVDREEFEKILNVEVRTQCVVEAINRSQKTVSVRDYKNGNVYQESYDKLVLSPGGSPIVPNIPGIYNPRVFTLRNAEDTDTVKAFIQAQKCKNALIMGAGFIGLETAENLSHLGMRVTVVDLSDQVMGAWDREMATIIHHHLRSKNVNLVLNDAVTSLDSTGGATLKSGQHIKADLVILAIGVRPDNSLAKNAGLAIGKLGGINVNDGLITSDEHIFALGDAVEVKDRITHNRSLIPLAGIAHKQARVVAENICGLYRVFKDVQVTAIAKVFDLTIALTGRTEGNLIENEVNYKKSYIEAPSHAGYYPNASPMIFKLLFAAKTGRILGAQIIGGDGVDKRIDVVATAIQFGKTVYDLVDLELAYAPPFSSAKDPVNIAGMVAKNMLKEDYRVIHWDEIESLDRSNVVLVDLRTPEEFEIYAIADAINIPLVELRERAAELPKDKSIVVYCQVGKRGYFASKILRQLGFEYVYNLSGGYKLYNVIKTDKGTRGIFDGDRVTSGDEIQTLDEIVDKPETSAIPMAPALKQSAIEQGADCVIEIDACGLSCPGPILRLAVAMKKAKDGDVIKIMASDSGFKSDVETWSRKKGHTILNLECIDSRYTATLRKCG